MTFPACRGACVCMSAPIIALEVRQTAVQHRLGQLSNGLQQGQGHHGTNHGSRLQEPLLLSTFGHNLANHLKTLRLRWLGPQGIGTTHGHSTLRTGTPGIVDVIRRPDD